MKSARTQLTRQGYLELMNTTSNQDFRNRWTALYLRACQKELKKAVAATTA